MNDNFQIGDIIVLKNIPNNTNEVWLYNRFFPVRALTVLNTRRERYKDYEENYVYVESNDGKSCWILSYRFEYYKYDLFTEDFQL